jgi:hypothetical protein
MIEKKFITLLKELKNITLKMKIFGAMKRWKYTLNSKQKKKLNS